MKKSKHFESGFAETIQSTLFYHVIMMLVLIFKWLAGMSHICTMVIIESFRPIYSIKKLIFSA